MGQLALHQLANYEPDITQLDARIHSAGIGADFRSGHRFPESPSYR
jgi:hypothetical protein